MSKTEKSRRSASHAGRFYGSSKNSKLSTQRKREKTSDTFEDNDEETDDFDYMEETEESNRRENRPLESKFFIFFYSFIIQSLFT